MIGGILIALSSAGVLYLHGRVCGISGMASDLILWNENRKWSSFFLIGLVFGGFLLNFIYPKALLIDVRVPYLGVVLGGFLVGFGARLGGGCTSGHGICGIGLLNKTSIVATIIFLSTGILTASLLYHFILGDPHP